MNGLHSCTATTSLGMDPADTATRDVTKDAGIRHSTNYLLGGCDTLSLNTAWARFRRNWLSDPVVLFVSCTRVFAAVPGPCSVGVRLELLCCSSDAAASSFARMPDQERFDVGGDWRCIRCRAGPKAVTLLRLLATSRRSFDTPYCDHCRAQHHVHVRLFISGSSLRVLLGNGQRGLGPAS